MAMGDWVEKYKAWPKWARIAAPVTVGFLAVGAIGSATEDDASSKKVTTTTTVEVEGLSISEATELALEDARAAGLTETETKTLVRATCDAAGETDGADTLAGLIVNLDVDRAHLRPLITALGDAAEAFCPDKVADAPDLLNDTYAAGVVLIDATTTTTTEAVTTTTVAPTTTAAPVTTVPRTTTTRPPTTTTRPPTTQPATTQPPSGSVTPGAYCSPVGATGYSSGGVPMTCSTNKCDGTPYDQPRWRKTNC